MISYWWHSLWRRPSCRKSPRCLKMSWNFLLLPLEWNQANLAKKAEVILKSAALIHNTELTFVEDMSPCMSSFWVLASTCFCPPSQFFSSLWWSDNSPPGASCLPVCVLATYPRHTGLHPPHPPTDSFAEEFAPFLFNCTNCPNHHRPPSNTAHC